MRCSVGVGPGRGGECGGGGGRGWGGGSGGEMVWDVDARWDCLRIVGELGSCSSFSFSSGGASMLSRPLGTKCRICGWRVPRDESVSARERASPRRSSTS